MDRIANSELHAQVAGQANPGRIETVNLEDIQLRFEDTVTCVRIEALPGNGPGVSDAPFKLNHDIGLAKWQAEIDPFCFPHRIARTVVRDVSISMFATRNGS
jgi:hypothetical protein